MTASKMPEALTAEAISRMVFVAGDTDAMMTVINRLVAENEALRKRYELIKQSVYGEDSGIYVDLPIGRAALSFEQWNNWPDIDGFDAAIDAAIDQARGAEC